MSPDKAGDTGGGGGGTGGTAVLLASALRLEIGGCCPFQLSYISKQLVRLRSRGGGGETNEHTKVSLTRDRTDCAGRTTQNADRQVFV